MKTLFLSLLLILQSIPFAQAQAVPNTYNNSGIPQTKTVRTFNGLLSRIDPAVLHDTRKINPNYLSLDPDRTNVTLRETANIRITFLKEGAGYKNWFGYFTYTGANPPSNPTLTPIFPNVSQGSGLLQYGDTVLLGSFPTGTKIGFAIVSNGFNNSSNGGYLTGSNYPKFYSIRTLNPNAPDNIYGSGSYSSLKIDTKNTPVQRIAYFWDTIDQVGVIGFDDQLSGDYDFDDVVFTISSDPVAAIIPPDDVPITTVSGVLCHLENNNNYTSIAYSGESARDTLFAAHADHEDDIKNMATCPAKKTNVCHIPGGQDASAAKIISVGNPALANGHENGAHGGDFAIDPTNQADIDRCFSTLCRESDGTTFKHCCNIKLNPNNYNESVETLTSGNDPHYAGQTCPYVIPTPTPTSPPVVIPTPTPTVPAPTPTPEIVYPAAVCHAEPVTLPEHPTYTKTSGDADHAVHILNGQDVLPDEAGNCPAHIETTYTICHVLARDPLTNNITNSVEQTINQSEYANHFSSSANHQYTDIEKPISGGCPVAVPDEQISICHYDVPEYSEPVSAKVFKIGSTVTGSESSLTSSHLNAHSAQGDFKIANDLNGNACTSICVAGCDITDPTPNTEVTPDNNSTPSSETYSCETTHPNDSCCMSVNESGVTTWKQCCESPSGTTLTSGEDPHNSGVMCDSHDGTPAAEVTPNPTVTPPTTPTDESNTCETVQPGDACCDSVNNGVVTWKPCCKSPDGAILTSGNDPHNETKVCASPPTPDSEPTANTSECTTVCKLHEEPKKVCSQNELDEHLGAGWSTNLTTCAEPPPQPPGEKKSLDFLVQMSNMLISSAVGYVGSAMTCVPPAIATKYFKVVSILTQIMDLFVAAKGVGATGAALQWVMSSYGAPWITEKIVWTICKTMGLSETLAPVVQSGLAKTIIQTLVSSFVTSASNYALTEGLDVDEWGDIGKGTVFGKTQTAKMEKTDPQIASIKKQIYNTQGQLELNSVQLTVAYTKLGFYGIALAIELVDSVSSMITGKALVPSECSAPVAMGCVAPAPTAPKKVEQKKANPPYQISSGILEGCAADPKCEITLPAVKLKDGTMRLATLEDYKNGTPVEPHDFNAEEVYKQHPQKLDPKGGYDNAHNRAMVLQDIIMKSNGLNIATENGNNKVPFQGTVHREQTTGAVYTSSPDVDRVVDVTLKFKGGGLDKSASAVNIQFSSKDVATSFTAWASGVSATYAGNAQNVNTPGNMTPEMREANAKFHNDPEKMKMVNSLGEKMTVKSQNAIVKYMIDNKGVAYEDAVAVIIPKDSPEWKDYAIQNPNAVAVINSQAPQPTITEDAIQQDKLASNYNASQASRITTQFSNNEILIYSGRYNFSITRVFGSKDLPAWSLAAKAFDANEAEKVIQKVVKIKLQLCGTEIDTASCKETFDTRFIPWIKSQFEGTPISEPIFEAEFTDANEKVKLRNFLLEAGYISSKIFDQFRYLMNKLVMPNAIAEDEKPGFWAQSGTGATMALGSFALGKIIQPIINLAFTNAMSRAAFFYSISLLQGFIIKDLYDKREVLNDQLEYQKKLLKYICKNLGGTSTCGTVSDGQKSSWEKTLNSVAPAPAAPVLQAPATPTPETTLFEKPVSDDLYSFIEEFKNKFFIESAQANVQSPYQVKSIKIGKENMPINFSDDFIKAANQIDPNMMKIIHGSSMSLGKIGNNFVNGKAETTENSKDMSEFINSQAKIDEMVKKATIAYNAAAKKKKENTINPDEMGKKSLAGLRGILDKFVSKEQLSKFFNIGGVSLIPTQSPSKGQNQDEVSSDNSAPTQVAAVTGVKNNTSTTKPAMKKETRLEDMDVELQDISTNGSNSIFRIISNRYLKVYNN